MTKKIFENNKRFIQNTSSFTLVELLVVIGILAVLTTAVVIILNPTDYLAQARDSRRLNDLSLLNNSLQNLEVIDPTLSFGTSLTVYISIPDDASSTCGTLGLPALPPTYTYNCVSTANLTKTNGTGWVPVNFTTQSIVQLSALPIDPTNEASTGNYYTYMPGGSWKLAGNLESSKHALKAVNDGGGDPLRYEIGTSNTTIPNPYIAFWYKADTGVQTSGSNVTQWDDQSGFTRHMTPGAGNFTLVNSVQNGKPGVKGATSAYLKIDDFDYDRSKISIFASIKAVGLGDSSTVMAHFNDILSLAAWRISQTSSIVNGFESMFSQSGSWAGLKQVWQYGSLSNISYILSFIFNNGESNFRKNGSENGKIRYVYDSFSLIFPANGPIILGNTFTGYFLEVMAVIGKEISEADTIKIENYLNSRWAVY